MATIQCQGCKKRIIQKGEKCPHCGEPIPYIETPKNLSKHTTKIEKKENTQTEIPENTEDTKLIKCRACDQMISKNAVSCPHCGEPLNNTEKTHAAVEEYVAVAGKSRLTSFLLTLLLGPIGLLYASISWGIIMIIVAIISAPTGVGPLAVWVLSILIGDSMTHNHNEKLLAHTELLYKK